MISGSLPQFYAEIIEIQKSCLREKICLYGLIHLLQHRKSFNNLSIFSRCKSLLFIPTSWINILKSVKALRENKLAEHRSTEEQKLHVKFHINQAKVLKAVTRCDICKHCIDR